MSTDVEPDRDAREYDLRQAWRTLSVVSLASVVSAFNATSLNIALPAVTDDLGASATQATAVLVGFQFTMTALMLLFGRLADLSGRRPMYLAGLAVFAVASLAVGLAPGVELVIAFRVVQAVGAAMLLTNSAALVSDAFPRSRLGEAMGFYIASFSIASLFGPVAGGLLIDTWGWRWLFLLNVPLCLVCLVWAVLALPPDRERPQRKVRLDLVGNGFALVALGSLLWGLSRVSEGGWADPVVLWSLVGFATLLPVFVAWELRYPEPLFDVSLFADRGFGFGLAGTLLNAVSRFPPALLLPVHLQTVGGLDAGTAGLWVLPFVLASLAGSIGYGLVARFTTARAMSTWSSAAATVGLGLLAVTAARAEPGGWYLAGQVLVGLGSGAFMPACTTVMLERLPSRRLGVANGLRLVVLNTGATLGTALGVSLVVAYLGPGLADRLMAGQVGGLGRGGMGDVVAGFELAYGVCFLVSLAGVLVCLVEGRSGRGAGRRPRWAPPR